MKTQNLQPLFLALSLALTLVARAQEPANPPTTGPASAGILEWEKLPVLPFTANSVNVEIDVSFVTFDQKEIQEMARKSPNAAPTQDQILKAWAEGRGRLLATSKAVTIANQQTKNEGIMERIYPTEFEPPRVWDKQVPTTKDDWASLPTPGGFQTRNVGLTVNATPVISDDGKTVQVTMIPDFSEFLRWTNIDTGEDEGKRTSKMWVQQPDFYVRRTTTSLLVPVDGTVVSGGMPDSTGKLVTYVFVTAHVAQSARKK